MLPWEEECPPRILKLIRLGLEEGWNNHTSLVARFQKPQAQPFFGKWDLIPETGRWKFIEARSISPVGAGLVAMGARDIEFVLQDPELVYVLDRTQAEAREAKREADGK